MRLNYLQVSAVALRRFAPAFETDIIIDSAHIFGVKENE